MPHKFRELVVWQRAMTLVTDVYVLTRLFPREETYGLTSQLRRAAISVPLNIAEGAGNDSNAEFARFFRIALRSLYETMTAIEISERLGYCQREQADPLLAETDQLAAMLTTLTKRIAERLSQKTIYEHDISYDVDSQPNVTLSDNRLLTPDYSLRPADIADLPAVLAVLHAAFAEQRGVVDPPSGVQRETVASLREHMAASQIVVADAGGAVVGCVVYRAESDHMYFGRLAVLPAYRRRGIGAALVAHVEQQARDLGLPCVRLGVRVELAAQRAQYERRGYRWVADTSHAGYTRPTAVVMEKELTR